MLNMKILVISHVLLVSTIAFTAIQASPLPSSREEPPADRTARAFPSTNRKYPNQLETTDSKSVNYTGSVSGSEEFTSWHQEQRNISSGDGDLLDVDDSNVGNNATLPGSTNSSKSENNTCTLEPASLCYMDPVHSQRNKELRLNAIKEYVIRSLLGTQERQPPRINKDALMNRFSPFSGQLQTFYASCDSPANVDLDTWTSPSFFHIYFNVTSTSSAAPETLQQVSQNRSAMVSHEYVPVSNSRSVPIRKPSGQYQQTVNIISAKLRLYKTGHGTQAEASKYEAPNPSEPCNDTDSSSEISPTIFPTSMELPAQGLPVPDERIRVTVYWYTAPLTKNHLKKKLLDTKMLSVKDSKWVDFDIQKAAKAWLDKKINYGLVVEVENEDNDIVDARKYFSNLPCELITGPRNNNASSVPSDDETLQVQPESGRESVKSTTQTMEILPPPVVEICTLTVPSAPRNTEFEPTSFFPFPFQMGPSGYPISVTPKQTPRPIINPNELLQNDDLNTANDNSNQHQNHPHRHNHGRNKSRPYQHKKNNNTRSQQFKLDDDHPLRQILATAPSSINSRENRRNIHRSNINSNSNSPRGEDQINTEDYVYVDDEDREEGAGKNNREIIIQKIYITPPQVNTNSNNNDERSAENLNR